ncbi:hypothetical protein XELAEV_18000165mg [Xenopus laevis]|uniref:Reverse transcriptase domain-containing protein n=1 Tax=Xenopus laevis TaxID=8355 RepID=A0A974GZJ9_XENLA|nr:hypothetical protein XELAEV_18000165mg [Xenopus laevis]
MEAKQLLETYATSKAKKNLEYTKYKFYRWGNKTGKLLAALIKPRSKVNHILKLQALDNRIPVCTPQAIKTTLEQYFRDVYSAEDPPEDLIAHILHKASLSEITQTQRDTLNAPITDEEVTTTIRNLANNKSPGPDGYTAEYYKILSPHATRLLTNVYNAIYQKGDIATEQIEAYTTLLPKPKFQSGRALTIYQDWGKEGVTTIRQLTKKDTRKPLTCVQLQTTFPSVVHNVFAFLQAQMYTSRTIRLLTDKDWDNSLDRFLLRVNSTKGTISQNYKFMQVNTDYVSIPKGPKQWTVDIPDLSMEVIFGMYKQLWRTLPSSIYREMFLNLLHRTYLTPEILYKMQRRDNSNCPKCGQPGADLMHCLWSSAWALWGITPNTHTRITRGAKRLLLIITAVAKKTILQVWITNSPPTVKLFLEKLVRVFYMDWIEASLNKNAIVQRFFETWETFIDIVPQTIRLRLHECFFCTEWYITRTIHGDPPINL